MEGYYFLYLLAGAWLIFATIQDLRKREVANWLNFSLIAFGIAYKIFYSFGAGNFEFLFYGLIGFGIFVLLAYGFYYGRVFGGGDAKLLMAMGAVLPFSSYWSLVVVGAGFLFLLFLVGALWTLIYSVWVVHLNFGRFSREFGKELAGKKWVGLILILLSLFSLMWLGFRGGLVIVFGVILFVILLVYVKAVDRCMVRLVGAGELTEGDWLEREVRLNRGIIRKSVHGLSFEEIGRIRKAGKKVWIKEGVPFVPAFLFAFLIMVFFLEVSGFDFLGLLAALS